MSKLTNSKCPEHMDPGKPDMNTDTSTVTSFTIDELRDRDPEGFDTAYEEIMQRHWLAVIRQRSDRTLSQVADERGVTKGAAHQTETKPFASLRVGTFIGQLRGCGYDVDEEWLITTITNALGTAPRT